MSVETYHGLPCERGHTLRYRSNRKCVACACKPRLYLVPVCPGVWDEFNTLEEAQQHLFAEDGIWVAKKL